MSIVFFIIIIILVIFIFSSINSMKEEKVQRLKGAGNKERYPNFKNAIKKIFLDDFQLHADNGNVVTYKIYTTFSNKKVGETFFILGLSADKLYLRQSYKGYDKTQITTEKYYLNTKDDLSIEKYLEIFEKFSLEIATDSRYIKSVSGLLI